MSQNKYFYVITNDKQIFEIPYTFERISKAVRAMKEKEIFTIKDTGMIINGAYIMKILDTNQYSNYIKTINPTRYIKDGTWYDGKENRAISHEPWKEEQIKNNLFIEEEKQKMTDEDREKANEARERINQELLAMGILK